MSRVRSCVDGADPTLRVRTQKRSSSSVRSGKIIFSPFEEHTRRAEHGRTTTHKADKQQQHAPYRVYFSRPSFVPRATKRDEDDETGKNRFFGSSPPFFQCTSSGPSFLCCTGSIEYSSRTHTPRQVPFSHTSSLRLALSFSRTCLLSFVVAAAAAAR